MNAADLAIDPDGDDVNDHIRLSSLITTASNLAYFPFDGSATDASGNGLAGTALNAAFVPGRFGSALSVNGTIDSRVEVPANLLLAPRNAVSISLWFNALTIQRQYACLIYKPATAPTSAGFSDRSYTLWVTPGGGGVHLTSTAAGADSQTKLDTTSGLFGVNEWVHVVGVIEAQAHIMSAYLNGNLITTAPYPGNSILAGTYPLRIGSPFQTSSDQAGFNGLIDEVRIYDRALSSQEVRQLYELGSVPPLPSVTTPPQDQSAQPGSTVTFNAGATGTPPLIYQWRKNGANIPGATSLTLTLDSVTARDSASYSVMVSNAHGAAQSTPAYLSVLTDGANGMKQEQLGLSGLEPPKPDQDSLVFITHGRTPPGEENPHEWVGEMEREIRARVSGNWYVIGYEWTEEARDPVKRLGPFSNLGIIPRAEQIANDIGARLKEYSKLTPNQRWKHAHLIAHSAGSAMIQKICEIITNEVETIHLTFLDPYALAMSGSRRSDYGSNADFADNYFAAGNYFVTKDKFSLVAAGALPKAFNADVSWLDTNRHELGVYDSALVIGNTGPCRAYSTHSWPYRFYLQSVKRELDPCGRSYGFALSKEAGGWDDHLKYEKGDLEVLCPGSCPLPENPDPFVWLKSPEPIDLNPRVNLDFSSHRISSSGAVTVSGGGFGLKGGPAPILPQSVSKQRAAAAQQIPPGAAWLAVSLPVTNAVNFVQFEAEFTSLGAAEGLFTVWWNTNQIGVLDERVTDSGLQTYRFPLPNALTNGLYTLSFRLDTFNETTSSIVVTNIATGFFGVTNAINLVASLDLTGRPVLQLTGASGYSYLLEASTNLLNWSPAALLVSTNGRVLFAPEGAISKQQFYRAIVP
jgi:hypothetical protein